MGIDSGHVATKVSPARWEAYKALETIQQRNAFAHEIIDTTIDRSKLDAPDKAFATRLVLGVVSTRGVLNEILNRCLKSPKDVKAKVRIALCLSIYEMFYLGKSSYAAVDQGVELVRGVTPRAAGLANAVLRKAAKLKETFPFGDPRSDLAAFARVHGFPLWLMDYLIKVLGPQEAHAFARASNEPAPLFIAVNTCRISDQEIEQVFTDAHFALTPGVAGGVSVPGCYQVHDRHALTDGRIKRLLNNGDIIVSDAASQAVAYLCARALFLNTNHFIAHIGFLELCAGRGTKTILLQSALNRLCGEQIEDYVLLDNRAFKTKIAAERAKKMQVQVKEALTGDATQLSSFLGNKCYGGIFIDAPCSGLGTLRRHPEIRWRLTPRTIKEDAQRDIQLLTSAANHVEPGGLLVYATCSVTVEENQQVVDAFLGSSAGDSFTRIAIQKQPFFQSKLEPGSADAHFCVIMRKRD